MTEQKVSLDRNDFIRQKCKIDKCPNWTCRAYDSICLHHITHKEGLLQDPREFSRRMTMKGNFGFRMHDGTTFAAVFHGGVFVCDGPGQMRNPLKQAERAEQIEQSYVNVVGEDDQSSWAAGSKRYLFAVMNGFDDFYQARRKGAVYDSPQLVKDLIFDDVKFKPQLEECVWPGCMDLYIVDPTIPEEMDFLVSIMEDVPDKRCFTMESLKWWTVPFQQAERRKEYDDSSSDGDDPISRQIDA